MKKYISIFLNTLALLAGIGYYGLNFTANSNAQAMIVPMWGIVIFATIWNLISNSKSSVPFISFLLSLISLFAIIPAKKIGLQEFIDLSIFQKQTALFVIIFQSVQVLKLLFNYGHSNLSFKQISSRNRNLYLTYLISILGYASFFIYFQKVNEQLVLSISMLLFIQLFWLSDDFAAQILKKIKRHKSVKDKDLKWIEHLDQLNQIRTFVFEKDKIISNGIYKFKKMDNRSTVQKQTILNLVVNILENWHPEYREHLMDLLMEYETLDLKVLQESEHQIIVEDKTETRYKLERFTHYQELETAYTLYFFKEDLNLAKILMADDSNEFAEELMAKFNKLGNTVLLADDLQENGNDLIQELYIDKAYCELNHEQRDKLLRLLNKKAPTALFTTNEHLTQLVDLPILINAENKNESKVFQIEMTDLENSARFFSISDQLKDMGLSILYVLFFIQIVIEILQMATTIPTEIFIGIMVVVLIVVQVVLPNLIAKNLMENN